MSNLSEKSPHVGILSSVLKPANAVPHPGLSILEELKSQYDVSIIPYFSDGLTDTYDVLIVFDTPVIRKATKEHRPPVKVERSNHNARPFPTYDNANAALSIKPSKNAKSIQSMIY